VPHDIGAIVAEQTQKRHAIARSPQIVVIGGGVFGCCAAYQLAKSGARTTLVERDGFGAHASGRNPGNLNPILGTAPQCLPLALESFRMHEVLQDELAALGCASYGVEPVRRVLVAYDDADRDELDNVARLFASADEFSTMRLDANDLQRIEPRLSGAIREGLLIEGNRSLDSRAFNLAMSEAAKRAGASVVRAEVQHMNHRAHTVSSVHTSIGEITCDAVVVATGPWVAQVNEWLGVALVVEPVKGEMLRVRLPHGNVTHDYTHGLISLYRRGDDEVWIGVTRERSGFDDAPTDRGRRTLIDGAARILPSIRDAAMIEHLASLRPMTPSGLPVIGRAPGWKNAFIANGGGSKGVLLCAGVGIAIRDLVLTGETTVPLNGFAPEGVR
jgi:glycine oxidase